MSQNKSVARKDKRSIYNKTLKNRLALYYVLRNYDILKRKQKIIGILNG
jgi:hypothetical protein